MRHVEWTPETWKVRKKETKQDIKKKHMEKESKKPVYQARRILPRDS